MLLLIAETSLHNCGAKIAEDTSGSVVVLCFVLGLGTFAGKAGCDTLLGAVFAGFIIGIDSVTAKLLDINSGQFLLILNAFLYPYPFIESLKGVMLDEGYAVYLYVVDLGSELGGFVFLSTFNGAYVWAVNADNAVFDFLTVVMVSLLAQDFANCHQPALLVCGQMYGRLELAPQAVPLREQFVKERQQSAQQLLSRILLWLALLGVGKTGLVDIIE